MMRFLFLVLLCHYSLALLAQQDSLDFYLKGAEQAHKQGNTQVALTGYLRVAFVQENVKDEKNLPNTYETIAKLYQNKQIYQKSLDYCLKSYKIRQNQNNKIQLLHTLQQLGMSYYLVNNFIT